MENLILVAVLALILTLAIRYIVKAKKSGRKCIGCPGSCGKACDGTSCDCCSGVQEEE